MGKRYYATIEIRINADNDIMAEAKAKNIMKHMTIGNGSVTEDSYEPNCIELSKEEGLNKKTIIKENFEKSEGIPTITEEE